MLRRATVTLAFGLGLVLAGRASALVWPDVSERVERDLSAPDPATRRAAARDLRLLGPTRGVPLAIAALSDTDDEVRLAAADAAIRLRAPGAAEAVAGWLNAPDVRARRKACEVARALPSPRVVAPLARTLGDPDAEVRAQAAEALGRQASADAVPPLLGRLDDPAPAVRIQIIASLSRLGDPRAVVPLVGKVEDSSPEVRQAVVRALGDLSDPRASAALVLALRDENVDVRRDALAALGRTRAADAVDAIAPFVGNAPPPLRLAAIEALGHIATAEAVRLLVGALGAADDASGGLESTPVRDALVGTSSAAIPSLTSLLAGSPSPTAATSAAWVLGELHAHGASGAIVGAMRRGSLPTAAALHALAGAGTDAHVPLVLEFIADRSASVREQALDAALVLLDPTAPDGRAVEPLTAALRDERPTPAERARIATLLGRTGARRAAPVLAELTRARDVPLRLAAIDALGALGPTAGDEPSVNRALLESLGDADPGIRLHAATALSEAGGQAARDTLLATLVGSDEVDRAATLTALGGVLSRVSTDAAVAKLAAALDLTAGPERDAMVEAVGRAQQGSATRVLLALARSDETGDRRAAVTMCAMHAADPMAVWAVRSLLADPDASVRAQAAWSLGAVGDMTDLGALRSLAQSADGDAATNATAAIGRIANRIAVARSPEPLDLAARHLCPLLGDRRAFVRANALAGLARSSARCGDGSPERSILSSDPAEDVRLAAVLAVTSSASRSAADQAALDRCTRADASSAVALRCGAVPAAGAPLTVTARGQAVLLYVVPDGSNVPRPNASYAVRFADGSVRAGITDRRGAVFEVNAPAGDVSLRRPAP